MAWKRIAIWLGLILAACGIGYFAYFQSGDSSESELLAAAIEGFFLDEVAIQDQVYIYATRGEPFPISDWSICLESKMPINVGAINKALSHTILTTHKVSDCTSKTTEGDFGMFNAMTDYFDPSGERAGHLIIQKITCPKADYCLVEIDTFSDGYEYKMRLVHGRWQYVDKDIIWVV